MERPRGQPGGFTEELSAGQGNTIVLFVWRLSVKAGPSDTLDHSLIDGRVALTDYVLLSAVSRWGQLERLADLGVQEEGVFVWT
uniref:Uncharacterized protein n=1 Tax=Knipowitschia caucasica TaxID=637954 RepID=A0AAV2LJ07_KNICA